MKRLNEEASNSTSLDDDNSPFLQSINRYNNPFITESLFSPNTIILEQEQHEEHQNEMDSEDEEDNSCQPSSLAPARKFRRINSSNLLLAQHNLETTVGDLACAPSVFDDDEEEEDEEVYDDENPRLIDKSKTVESLLNEFQIQNWYDTTSDLTNTKITDYFMSNKRVISLLHGMRLHYGLEIEFGSTLLYKVWESSQRRLFSQLMLSFSPDLYRENIEEMKRYAEPQPGVEFLKRVVDEYFVKQNYQNNDLQKLIFAKDLSSDEELSRVAKFVVNSKRKRVKLLSCSMDEWNEELDVMSNGGFSAAGASVGSLKSINLAAENMRTFENSTSEVVTSFQFIENTSGRSFVSISDEDPLDPETRNLTDPRVSEARYKRELYRINRWKTEGAYLRRLYIGELDESKSFSPNLFYDGQSRIKCSPLLKKLYYKFFTHVPRMLNIEDVLRLLVTEPKQANDSFTSLETHVFRELDRFKVSLCLKMEIAFEDICGLHIQKAPSGPYGWALLVLKLSKRPKFYARRVMCSDRRKNLVKQRNADFTPNNIASKYSTHYIIGDERELKRIIALMIEVDSDVGHISNLYKKGLDDISFPTKPDWVFEEKRSNNHSKQREIAYPSKISFKSTFLCKEDEEHQRVNEELYDSDGGVFPFDVSVAKLDSASRSKYERRQLQLEDLVDLENKNFGLDECFVQ